MSKHRFRYLTCCVNSTAQAIDDMMDRAREIQCSTFKRRCDWKWIEESFGYSRGGLRLHEDYCVRFFRSRYRGRKVYVMVHSAIEYIFA